MPSAMTYMTTANKYGTVSAIPFSQRPFDVENTDSGEAGYMQRPLSGVGEPPYGQLDANRYRSVPLAGLGALGANSAAYQPGVQQQGAPSQSAVDFAYGFNTVFGGIHNGIVGAWSTVTGEAAQRDARSDALSLAAIQAQSDAAFAQATQGSDALGGMISNYGPWLLAGGVLLAGLAIMSKK